MEEAGSPKQNETGLPAQLYHITPFRAARSVDPQQSAVELRFLCSQSHSTLTQMFTTSTIYAFPRFENSTSILRPHLELAKTDNLDKIPVAYATVSIGCKEDDTLPRKLEAIAAAGFSAIELGFPDIQAFANRHLKPEQMGDGPNEIAADDYDSLCNVTKIIKTMCDAKGLKVLMLQPFANFEGWAEGSAERKDAWARVEGWMRIMEAAGTDMLQVGSSDSPEDKIGKDRSRFVKDLQELADKLAVKGYRVAYENWCWSTHAPDWEDVWDICKQVDRENFGLCLDTFQSAGGAWGDPTTQSGIVDDGRSKEQIEKDWKASCDRLAKTIPKDKIYLLQISDAYKQDQPLDNKEVDGLRPRGRWSHDHRPLPFEGYLPVVDFTRAVLQTGFRGYFSYEIFDNTKPHDMIPYAENAYACQHKLLSTCSGGT